MVQIPDGTASGSKLLFSDIEAQVYATPEFYTPQQIVQFIDDQTIRRCLSTSSQGFSNDFFWISFELDTIGDFILELDKSAIDNVELYENKKGWKKIGYGGDKGRTFYDRTVIDRRFVFPLRVEGTIKYLLMVDKRNASVGFPLKLWGENDFKIADTRKNIIFSFYFGFLLLVILVSLAMGITLKNQILIFYAFYAWSVGIYLFTILGFSFQYLYPQSTNLNNYMAMVTATVAVLSFALFVRSYFSIPKHFLVANKVLNGVIISIISLFVLWGMFFSFFDAYSILIINVINAIMLILFIVIFYSVWHSIKINKEATLLFIAAFSFLILGSIAYLGVEYGYIPESTFFVNPIVMGVSVELLILFIAMVRLVGKTFTQKEILQAENTEMEQDSVMAKQRYTILEEQYHELKKEYVALEKDTIATPGSELIDGSFLLLKSKQKIVLKELMYISADGHYLKFFISGRDRFYLDRNSIKDLLKEIHNSQFVQIHRSYIVNINFLAKIKASEVTLKNGIKLPVSRTYKSNLKGVHISHN